LRGHIGLSARTHDSAADLYSRELSSGRRAMRNMVAVGLVLVLCGAAAGILAAAGTGTRADDAPTAEASVDGTKTALFAGGCFWCVESDFDKVPGVVKTVSGYTGGHVPDPSYEQVSSETTGHYESVLITYDPDQV